LGLREVDMAYAFGLVAWRKDLRGGSKDLMQRRMEEGM